MTTKEKGREIAKALTPLRRFLFWALLPVWVLYGLYLLWRRAGASEGDRE